MQSIHLQTTRCVGVFVCVHTCSVVGFVVNPGVVSAGGLRETEMLYCVHSDSTGDTIGRAANILSIVSQIPAVLSERHFRIGIKFGAGC